MCINQIWVVLYRLSVMGKCLFKLALQIQRISKVIMCRGITRSKLKRLGITSNSFIKLVLRSENISSIEKLLGSIEPGQKISQSFMCGFIPRP